MGAKVGVVTTVGCPHCKRAKGELKSLNVDYEEAQLAGARDVLAAVKEATGQSTVPQVFIGSEFIGGAAELHDIVENKQLDQKLSDAEGKSAFPENISKLLAQVKDEPGESQKDGELDDELKRLEKELHEGLPQTHRHVGQREVACAFASEVASLLEHHGYDVTTTAPKLLEARVLVPVTADPDTASFDASMAFRDEASIKAECLTYYATPHNARAPPVPKKEPLNAHFAWPVPARPAVDVSAVLREIILELYDKYLAPDGKAVDYDAMGKDPLFAVYVDRTVELQRVDVTELSRDEKIAFFVNIYNALIVHGTVALGVPSSVVKRLAFFDDAKYLIGGQRFSANDIEHGVLRNNAVSPAAIGSLLPLPGKPGGFLKPLQFKDGDARRKLAVDPLDPRIHFALVCGAKSCPPIKLYTPDNLDEGLQEAAVAFCASDIDVEMTKRKVTLSKIFKWYANDFDTDQNARLRKFASFCSGQKAEDLLALADSGKYKLSYKAYDWSVNSTH